MSPDDISTPIILRNDATWLENLFAHSHTSAVPVACELRAAADFIDRQNDEIAILRNALRRCRTHLRETGQMTLLRFAALCGVSGAQASEWTREPIESEPDFICGGGE